MIQKKVCMLGAFAVGKTSLVSRFVRSIFSDKYHTTVGVKIDKKQVSADGRDVNLILWDLAGEDEFQKVQMSYLRGASGYLLVADGTRPGTLDIALRLRSNAAQVVGDVPFVLIVNKADLAADWEISPSSIEEISAKGWSVIKGSAKTGEGVQEAFTSLVKKMLEG